MMHESDGLDLRSNWVIHITVLTFFLCPHAWHRRWLASPSLTMLVSGFPHSGHSTNSSAYCLIRSFILEEGIFVPSNSSDPLMTPGVASSFSRNLSMCSTGLRSVSAIFAKFEIMVLFPSRCPITFGISNRSFSNTDSGILALALDRSSL